MRKESGFTLLELLVGLAILGMMAALVFQGLNLGIRSWERGASIIESAHNNMFNWQPVSRQIRSAYPVKMGKNVSFFQGNRNEVTFVSTYSLRMADQVGLVRVIYRVARKPHTNLISFMAYEEPFLDSQRLQGKVRAEDFLEIGAVDGRISFSFLEGERIDDQAIFGGKALSTVKRSASTSFQEEAAAAKGKKGKKKVWKNSWGDEERSLPGKVKIALSSQSLSSDGGDMELVVPVMVNTEVK